MPVGESQLLFENQSVAGRSKQHVEMGDGDAVIVEAWPTGSTGAVQIEVLDSVDDAVGFRPVAAPSGAQFNVTSYLKWIVPNVLPVVTARITPSSGAWNVRMTPIRASGDTVTGRTTAATAAAANHAEAVNAPAVLTYAAGGPQVRHVLGGVSYGYSGAPAAGATLTVADGATVVRRIPVTAAGPQVYPWPDEAYTADTALTVTLSAGGAGVTGYVDALGKRTEY